MYKISTLLCISDNTLDIENQIINLDQFFETMDNDLEMVFGNFELSPAVNIHQLVNRAILPNE